MVQTASMNMIVMATVLHYIPSISTAVLKLRTNLKLVSCIYMRFSVCRKKKFVPHFKRALYANTRRHGI